MVANSLWLRCETKEFERRAALTPSTARKLIEVGFKIYVERDQQRIFDDEEYEKVGCELVPNNSWYDAPADVIILGLKELPDEKTPLHHTHIYFGHCFKGQAGWSTLLGRFQRGGGILYDLEFLTDAEGRRVAAFGFHAGFTGAAAGLLAFAAQKDGGRLSSLTPFDNENAMTEHIKKGLPSIKNVRALVIGALGRCGRGAIDLLRKVGLEEDNILKWDMAETAIGGPFPEILKVDIFINCIYLSTSIPPFITMETIASAGSSRRLSVVVDVSCDTTNPFNPIPIYNINTTFSKPTVDVDVATETPLTVISIDHLPTLLPREASEQFSKDLLPPLLELPQRITSRIWSDAEGLFKNKLAEATELEGLRGD